MPSGDLKRWNTDPWKLTEREGKLYGLGADDMKGGLSALVLGRKRLWRPDLCREEIFLLKVW